MTGAITLVNADFIVPGDRAHVRFVLDRAVALDRGVRFALREGSRTIGAGIIVSTDD